MKRFKLLKDAPCTKAGTVFEENVDRFNQKILVNKEFQYMVIVDKVNNFDEWFEEVSEYKRPRVKYEEEYYYIDDWGDIDTSYETGDNIDDYRYSIGDYGITSGELAEEIINAWNEQSDIWEESRESVSEYEHPTTKPVRLPSKAILNSSKTGDIVLDLFGGSGSTMSACEQTGRIPYLMELDPRYCDVIRRRYWKLKTGVEDGWEDGTRVANKSVEKIV